MVMPESEETGGGYCALQSSDWSRKKAKAKTTRTGMRGCDDVRILRLHSEKVFTMMIPVAAMAIDLMDIGPQFLLVAVILKEGPCAY